MLLSLLSSPFWHLVSFDGDAERPKFEMEAKERRADAVECSNHDNSAETMTTEFVLT